MLTNSKYPREVCDFLCSSTSNSIDETHKTSSVADLESTKIWGSFFPLFIFSCKRDLFSEKEASLVWTDLESTNIRG